MKITTCDDGFVAEINNDEDFDRIANILLGRDYTTKKERIKQWVQEMSKNISDSIPYDTDGKDLPYMYSELATHLLMQISEWAAEDME